MDKIVIFGIEQFADQIFNLLEKDIDQRIVAFCVDERYLPENRTKFGLPILPFEKLEDFFTPLKWELFFVLDIPI